MPTKDLPPPILERRDPSNVSRHILMYDIQKIIDQFGSSNPYVASVLYALMASMTINSERELAQFVAHFSSKMISMIEDLKQLEGNNINMSDLMNQPLMTEGIEEALKDIERAEKERIESLPPIIPHEDIESRFAMLRVTWNRMMDRETYMAEGGKSQVDDPTTLALILGSKTMDTDWDSLVKGVSELVNFMYSRQLKPHECNESIIRLICAYIATLEE